MALKERLTTAAILAYPDFDIRFTLYNDDAIADSIGFNLTQIQNNRKWAIAYEGRNFSGTEKNYPTTEREALSVIVAIQNCRPYLMGNHFTVVGDHQALQWLISLRYSTQRLARWDLILQGYNFTIQCRQGKDHVNADALSRCIYRILNNLWIPKLQQKRCGWFRTSMTSFNPLSYI